MFDFHGPAGLHGLSRGESDDDGDQSVVAAARCLGIVRDSVEKRLYLGRIGLHVPLQEELIQDGFFTVEGGQEATRALLDLPEPPSAIFSSGGVMSVGALLEMKQRNLKIPQELSFVSFDDEKWCVLIDPPLTVVAQPVNEIGTEAAQMVIQLI